MLKVNKAELMTAFKRQLINITVMKHGEEQRWCEYDTEQEIVLPVRAAVSECGCLSRVWVRLG